MTDYLPYQKNKNEFHHLNTSLNLSYYMTNLAVGGIAGFFLMGIAVLIIYFVYPAFEYSLAIGCILIIIGLVTVVQLKISKRL
jgi:uncharacterized membrane protein YqjE